MVLSSVFTDVDEDSLLYNVTINTEGIISAEIIGDTLIISTLPDQFGGPVIITITADDQQGAALASDQFGVTVEAVNDPPIITSTSDSTAWEDIEFVYQVLVDDVDNDLFYYNLLIYPDGMVVDSNGLITWTPEEGVLTSGLVTLTKDKF